MYESGPVGAPAIVFLHGAGLSGRMWRPQMERLAEYHCLAPDLPEHGRSAGAGPFLLEDSARRIASLIAKRVPAGRAHLVGLSLGGAVVLTMMRLTPERVDRGIVSGASSGLDRILGTIMSASGFLYALMPEMLIDSALQQFSIPDEYREECREDMRICLSPAFNGRMVDALTGLQLPTSPDVSPLLVAVGEDETLVAKNAAREIMAAVPGSQGVVVPDAGHVWNLEAPDLFAETVRAWITGTALPEKLRKIEG